MKKTVVLLLLLAMTVTLFAACGDSGDNPAQTTGGNSNQNQMTVATDEYGRPVVYNSIVQEGIRYDDTEITILYAGDTQAYDPSMVGEKVNDANFARDMSVETSLGVYLKWEFCEYGNSAKTYNNRVIKSIESGKTYNLLLTHGYYSAGMAIQGYYKDMASLQYLDFQQPWWTEKMMEEITVNGVTYFASGDMMIDTVASTTCLFYNKNMYSDHFSDMNIYDEVFEYTWTLEKFSEMVKKVYLDKTGDGTTEDDRLGLATSCTAAGADPFLYGFGVRVTEKNADGEVQIALGNEHSITAFGETYKLFRDNEGVYFRSGGEKNEGWTDYEWAYPKFVNSEALFLADTFSATSRLVDMDARYGVLPIPLLNESQKEYYSGGVGTLQAVPVNATDLEATAATIDLLNYFGYQYVAPMYFEKMLKTTYSDSPEDAAVYQLLSDVKWADFGIVYSHAMEDPHWDWRKQLREDSDNISKHWTSQNKVYTSKLAEIFDEFRKLPSVG